MKNSRIISVGLAIFAMLFGAGNVVFPLGLGRDVGSNVAWAIMGLILTGVIVPVIGLVSAALFNGDYRKFLGTIGRLPGALLAFICLILIGPFGATPRCVTLAYAAVRWHIPQLSLFIFSLIVACILFVATVKRRYIVELFGRFLAPIKLTLLFTIIILGLLSLGTPPASNFSDIQSFFKGLKEGYWTLDLLGTIFFSGLIISAIKTNSAGEHLTPKQIAVVGLKAGIIGGLLLGAVYTGFCVLAAKFSLSIAGVDKDQLLSALATLILGSHASILANTTMAIACLSTAIALTAVFADYLKDELFWGHLKYEYALLITVVITFAMTNLGFSGIAHVIEPIVVLCYPALITLSIANAAHVLWGFNYIRPVVFGTFTLTILHHFFG